MVLLGSSAPALLMSRMICGWHSGVLVIPRHLQMGMKTEMRWSWTSTKPPEMWNSIFWQPPGKTNVWIICRILSFFCLQNFYTTYEIDYRNGSWWCWQEAIQVSDPFHFMLVWVSLSLSLSLSPSFSPSLFVFFFIAFLHVCCGVVTSLITIQRNDSSPAGDFEMTCIISLALARTWGMPPPGRFCALYPRFLKLEIWFCYRCFLNLF